MTLNCSILRDCGLGLLGSFDYLNGYISMKLKIYQSFFNKRNKHKTFLTMILALHDLLDLAEIIFNSSVY